MSAKNKVCVNCVCDEELQKLIREESEHSDVCFYCQEEEIVVAVEFISGLVEEIIDSFYVWSGDDDAEREGGTELEGEPLLKIVENLIAPAPIEGFHNEIADHVTNELIWMWLRGSNPKRRYGISPFFVEDAQSAGQFALLWYEMLEKLRHEARYINPMVTETLDKILGPLDEDTTWSGDSVITRVGPGHQIDSFYRARYFNSSSEVKIALKHPENQIGPLPKGQARSGRMNALGVSVFYGSTKPQVAISEIRPPVGSLVITGEFRLLKQLRLLDLTKIPLLRVPAGLNLFHKDTLRKVQRIKFLTTLTSEMNQPVMPDAVDQGYLLTQVIADYLSTNKKLDLDGILFPSVQLPGPECEPNLNCVLFSRSCGVALASPFYEKKMSAFYAGEIDGMAEITLDYDEKSGHQIFIDPSIAMPSIFDPWDADLYTLRLDRDSLYVHQIIKAVYESTAVSVTNHIRGVADESDRAGKT